MFGFIEPNSALKNIAAIPEFIWELSLGVWLIVKGFNPSAAILSEPGKTNLIESGEERETKSLSKA